MSHLFDLPVYQDFVNPDLCKQLMHFGVTTNTSFHYRIFGPLITLNSYAFDHDDYYSIADANLDQVIPVGIVPAYMLKDVERPLPSYLLSRQEKGYVLMCEHLYHLPEQSAARLPDVFALMLLQGIKQRVIKLNYANKLIAAHS